MEIAIEISDKEDSAIKLQVTPYNLIREYSSY